MKKPSFPLPATATAIIILLVASFGYSLNLTAHAGSVNAEWRLTVTGLVEHPLNLTLADLFTMPNTTVYAALICVGPPPSLVTEGSWTGVRLGLLLQEAGVMNDAIKVAFYAADNYTTDLMLDTAQRDDVILAYERDGAPLNETLRLVVPGQSGYKWISEVTGIELVDYDFLGYYEKGGYPDDAPTSGYGIYPILPPLQSGSTNPSNSSNPVPSQTQSPPQTASPNASTPIQQPRPPEEIERGEFSPIGFFYAAIVATVVVIIIIVAAALTRKRRQGFTLISLRAKPTSTG